MGILRLSVSEQWDKISPSWKEVLDWFKTSLVIKLWNIRGILLVTWIQGRRQWPTNASPTGMEWDSRLWFQFYKNVFIVFSERHRHRRRKRVISHPPRWSPSIYAVDLSSALHTTLVGKNPNTMLGERNPKRSVFSSLLEKRVQGWPVEGETYHRKKESAGDSPKAQTLSPIDPPSGEMRLPEPNHDSFTPGATERPNLTSSSL